MSKKLLGKKEMKRLERALGKIDYACAQVSTILAKVAEKGDGDWSEKAGEARTQTIWVRYSAMNSVRHIVSALVEEQKDRNFKASMEKSDRLIKECGGFLNREEE